MSTDPPRTPAPDRTADPDPARTVVRDAGRRALVAFGMLALTAAPAASHPVQSQCEPAQERYCDEVRRLAEHPAVERAFRFIEETDDRTLREHIALTEIPAPPFGEEERAREYARLLREAGADSVWIDEEGNVLALRRGRGAAVGDEGAAGSSPGARAGALVLSGHLDTVFPEGTDVTVEQRGDTLFAPGIGDDTRGLMVVLTVLRALEAADIETESDVLFVGTVGEEGLGDLRGVKHLFRDGGPPIEAFISVDGGGAGRIVNKGLGSRRYRVTFEGPGGHSWGAFGTANPAHALGRAIHMFDGVADEYTATGTRTSYNVGRIGGGTSINSVPFEAWMEVDMRSESQERLMEIDSIFRAVMQRALDAQNEVRRRGPALEADVELVGDRPSGITDPDEPLVQRAIAATAFFGDEPSLARSSTDSNTPIALGIPAVTISRGGEGGDAHSPGEWWMNRDGPKASQRALVIVLAHAGLADGGT